MIRFLQIILGLLFLASGLAKGLTPFFSVNKLDEYLIIAGMDWLLSFDVFLLVALNTVEVTLGVMLIFNLHTKLALSIASVLMIIFTPKTLYVAVKGLMEYSGCFGRLVPITPWQSHWKNVFMDLIIVILWFNHNKILYKSQIKSHWLIISFTAFVMILLQIFILYGNF